MTENLWINMITSAPAMLLAVWGVWQGVSGKREARDAKKLAAETAEAAKVAVEGAEKKIDTIHIQINERMDQLLAAEKAKARSEGVEAGRGAESVVPIPIPIPRAREEESATKAVTDARIALEAAMADATALTEAKE